MPKNKLVGDAGELLAVQYLTERGYEILRRNYISEYGEIDIIASKDQTAVFVEVKTRQQGGRVPIKYTVSKAQQKRIVRSALNYFSEQNLDLYMRFDCCFIIYETQQNTYKLNYEKGAFDGSVLSEY